MTWKDQNNVTVYEYTIVILPCIRKLPEFNRQLQKITIRSNKHCRLIEIVRATYSAVEYLSMSTKYDNFFK